MTLPPRRAGRCPRVLLTALCVAAVVPGDALALALAVQQTETQTSPSGAEASRVPPDQLDSLVAPIALYPDPLLAQTLAASTYPLELMQLQQWLARNPGLKDQALAQAVSRQPWDPSIQAMAALPDVVKRLTDDIQWTADLGNVFLAQQSDVMDAVQRMRQKARSTGNLTATEQQTVETQVVERKEVIVIEQANPQVVYVPSYNPTVVYGAPVYPYPPIYYPPAGYYAAGAAISFGVGVAMGAAWGGGWGWGARWGDNDITINNNNNFNRNANINGGVRNSGNSWQHRPEHRGGAPYGDRATANRFGGTARGDSLANRQAGARQQLGRPGGSPRSGAVGTSGVTSRAGGAGLDNRPSASTFGPRASGGADRIGGRDLSRSNPGGNRSAFGGGDRFDGAGARASSSRGSSSMGSRSGGSRGGIGGGGGSRGGSRGGGRRR
jgi:hypothetical protein